MTLTDTQRDIVQKMGQGNRLCFAWDRAWLEQRLTRKTKNVDYESACGLSHMGVAEKTDERANADIYTLTTLGMAEARGNK